MQMTAEPCKQLTCVEVHPRIILPKSRDQETDADCSFQVYVLLGFANFKSSTDRTHKFDVTGVPQSLFVCPLVTRSFI